MYLFHIKEKKKEYIRFIITSPQNNFFKEKYFSIGEWSKIENNFLDIRKEINNKIQNNIFPKNEFKMLENEVRFFLSNKLEFFVYKTVIKIFWDANIFIPFEIMKDFNVVNIINSNYKKSQRKNKFVLIYSEEAQNSRMEVYKILELLKKKSISIEYFDEKNFFDYKSNSCDSSVIHISTHGRVNDEAGEIFVGGQWIRNIDFKLNSLLVFLNSCETGLYVEGIIKNLIDNGVNYTIFLVCFLDYLWLFNFYPFIFSFRDKNSIKNLLVI